MKANRKGLQLREIVVIASIAIVFGILYLLWIFFGQFVQAVLGPFGPIAWGLLAGVWVLAPIICAYIVRKPGTALIAEWIAAGTEVLAGSANAGVVLLLGFTQGLGTEFAFALFRYRSYRLPVLMLSGMCGMAANFTTIYYLYGYNHLAPIFVMLQFGAMLVSGALLGGWGGKGLADGLAKSGILNSFAIVRQSEREEKA